MRKAVCLAILSLLLLTLAAAAPQSATEYDKLKADAEREYGEKSFARAHEIYERAAKLELKPDDRRWVELRLADTEWRADAASPSEDPAARNHAREVLQKLADAKNEHDELWALANESLGDYHMTHPRERNQGAAQQWYLQALDWWAGSSDLPRARRRYLDIVWRLSGDSEGWSVPRHILVNVLAIAESDVDRDRARYSLALQLVSQGNPADIERGLELLEEIFAGGRKSQWYDDALYQYATHVTNRGQADDFKKALTIFRRIVAEHTKAESQYYDDAQRAITDITAPLVGVHAGGTFLPQSEQEVILSWRNVRQIQLTLTSVDLTKDSRFDNQERQWTDFIVTDGRAVVRRWTHDTNDPGEHRPGSTSLRLEPRLPMGAYILTATAEGKTAKQLVLVSDAHILVHAARDRQDVFVSDVVTGEPIPNARVHVWQRTGRNTVIERDAQTNADGLARITLGDASGQTLITAASGARQAFHSTWSYSYARSGATAEWRIYAFTDRPAYRPGESVSWKIIARARDQERWITPAGETLEYEVRSPRGEKVSSGTAKLSAFGSFASELAVTESMALGEYTIQFRSKDRHRGQAMLFRLEEYKLPEFLVSVRTPEGKQYRLGDTIEATIEASYYFGGPVGNATVELVVHQQPFRRYWYPWREYHWFYPEPPAYYGDTIVKRETLQTDAQGRATVRIDTPRDGNDSTYRIEARVVDASRREVRGEGNVRVMRQRYSVMAQPEHHVHRPGASVSVDFKALDANDKPVQTTGTVKVVRRWWRGAATVGDARRPPRPPLPRYEDEEILTTKLTTDAAGQTTLTFTPKAIGYYVIRWTSTDGPSARDVVAAETAVWVADRATTDLGYRAGGLDIIVDKETLRAGDTAAVMIVVPASGRWVLFTSTGDDIMDTQVLKLDGTVKLVQFPVGETHMPNFFVTASSVFDRNLATDSERLVVPPVEQFLTVDVKPDREQYEPRQEGTVTVTTRDSNGKPVSAEVALSVSDEAVTAIQKDPAGDPRQFFYGEVRGNNLRVSGGLQSQAYLDIKERTAEEQEKREGDEGYYAYEARQEAGVAGGVVGGVVGGIPGGVLGKDRRDMAAKASMAPQAVPAPASVAEAITVSGVALQVGNEAGIDVQVRTDFRSTAFWKPDVITDATTGSATVSVRYPEALTTWRATARAATKGAQFGMASSTARTNMPLIVRLQGPRFFVEGDRTVVSAVMNNNTDEAMAVTPSIEVEGLALQGGAAMPPLRIEPRGEVRADWIVLAEKAGPAKLRVAARSQRHSDGMERAFTVYEHGIDKLIARSGKLRGDEAIVRLDLPRERRATELTVQVAPSLAVAMLDALPYLVEFPYGCTEQTMSRFLPAAIVARTIEQLGLGRARLAGKDLDAVTAAGIARLHDMQHGDGGWGWWKEGNSDPFMTAYVVWGFAVAREGGLSVDRARVDRAAVWLERNLVEHERAYNDQSWMLHALSAWRKSPSAAETRAFENVWSNRERLTAYARALLALTAHRWGDAERARVLIRNLESGVQTDRTPDQSVLLKGETSAETMATAHWGATGFWWRWYEGPVETTSFALQALVTIDPKHHLVEPTMNWLVKNRRGARWSNTRDTAIALLALNDYLQRSGELAGDVSYELSVNGRVIATKSITAKEVLGAPSRFTIDPAVVADTVQEVRIRRTGGKSPLYFSAEARFVSKEEPIKAAGNEMFVRREYFRLAPRPTLLKGVLYDRVPLRDGDSIPSGERVEVVVTIDTKNDYSYLIFEDLKPAGFEAVELQSGRPLYAQSAKTGRSAWVYQELRDRKVALFIDHLDQGLWEIRYTLRAEVPGSFHALPLLGHAMYVPDIRANGEEVRVVVTE